MRGRIHAWEYATFCNFGEHARKRIIARHFSSGAANRAFKRLRKEYSHESREFNKDNWRCWQEDRTGLIINDTRYIDRMVYA